MRVPSLLFACCLVTAVTAGAAPRQTVVDLAGLPEWPVAAAGDAKVELVAADVDPQLLLLLTTDEGAPFIGVATRQRVTGRLSAPSLAAANAALRTAYPELGAPTAPSKKKKGKQRVSLEFVEADPRNAVRLVSLVLRRDVVVARGSLPALHLRVWNVEARWFLGAVAAALGWRVEERAKVLYVLPAGERLPTLHAKKGKKMALAANGARAAELLAFAGILQPVPFTAPCTDAPDTSLRLGAADVPALATAVQVASGVAVTAAADAAPCVALAPLAGPPTGYTLVAIASLGTKSAALFRAPDGKLYTASPDTTWNSGGISEIADSGVVVRDGDRETRIDLDPAEPEPPHQTTPRVAATLTGAGVKRARALLDFPGRGVRFTDDRYPPRPYRQIRIDRGAVELATEPGAETKLQLSRAP